MNEDSSVILDVIAQTIFDKKGFNTLALDVSGISSLTDFFVIAEGNVDRHVASIAKGLIDELEQMGEKPLRVEGLLHGDWVVIDLGHVIIHLFESGLREHYSLESLWPEARVVDVRIDVSPPGRPKAGNA